MLPDVFALPVRRILFVGSVCCLAQTPLLAANSFQVVATVGGGKAAFGDYNKDGWVDLHVGSQLYRNNNGTYVTATGPAGDGIWGDFDRDGRIDWFSYSNETLHRNTNGTTFQPVTIPGLGSIGSRGASFGDFNGDRYLDLYVGGYETPNYQHDKILTNNKNGTFSLTWTQPADSTLGPGSPRPGRGVTTADWDRDGDLDVYVSYYRLEPNGLWRNNGSGTFTDVRETHNASGRAAGWEPYGGHTIGSVFGDFNNDGLFDIFVGNFAHAGQSESRFLRNRGPAFDYAFQDMGQSGVFFQESYASPVAGDIDNDGDIDLYFTTVYGQNATEGANYPILYRNNGNFNFTDITTAWGLPKTGTVATYQAAFGDYNNDGFLDLVTDGKVYQNTGNGNHWVKIRLDGGDLFDAAATGTQVLINWNGQTLVRQVESSTGEGNQNDPTLHFGLGSHTGPLTLEIRWAGGGITQYKTITGVDQLVSIAGPKFGDTDLDGDVDLNDLSNLASAYGNPNTATWAMGDFDRDKDVDLNDLGLLASRYGNGEAQAFADFSTLIAIPEPAAAMLIPLVWASMSRRAPSH